MYLCSKEKAGARHGGARASLSHVMQLARASGKGRYFPSIWLLRMQAFEGVAIGATSCKWLRSGITNRVWVRSQICRPNGTEE